MYLAFGENASVSTGRCVFRNRRCVCASRAANLTSFGGILLSTQSDIACVSISVSPLKSNCETICCIHVVPDLLYVEMMMSSSRNLKSFQTVESIWWLCISRVFLGQAGFIVTSCSALRLLIDAKQSITLPSGELREF